MRIRERAVPAQLAVLLLATLAGAVACVRAIETPSSGLGTVWGYVDLVPHEGVTPGGAHGGGYADPALRDVSFVDYSKPGFAVVQVEALTLEPEHRVVALRETPVGLAFEPELSAAVVGSELELVNETRALRVVSVPDLDRVLRIPPGGAGRVVLSKPGELEVFALGHPPVKATLFVPSGRYSVVSYDGRWHLRDLPPGRWSFSAWRHRFPMAHASLDVEPDGIFRLDLHVRVDGPAEEHDASAR